MMETADKGKYLSEMLCQSQGESLTRFVGRIPVELGEFHIEERASRQGISVADWRMQWNSDIRVKKGGQEGRDMVQLVFFVNHGMAWEMEGRKAPVCMRQGEICLYRDRALGSEGEYEGGCQFIFKSVQIPTERFLRVTEECMGGKASREAAVMMDRSAKIKVTPRIKRLFTELSETGRYSKGLSDLYLEGKVWELVSEFFEVAGGGARLQGKSRVSRTDRAMVMQVKERIDRDCVDVPTSELLAKEAGMSISKLNRDFRAAFGTSLHAYVIEKRLDLAACLLSEGSESVSQVAAMCGYTNMSHFSSAFRRRYGVPPKDWSR